MFSSILLAEEALRRGIKLRHINDYQEENAFIELRYKNHFEYIFGSKSSQISAVAHYITENKALTKYFLEKKRIQFTEGKLFLCGDKEGIKEFAGKVGYPIVLKKYNGTHGNLVFLHIHNFEEGSDILKKYFRKEKYVLVEKEFKGREFRFMTTREKVLAVAFREPANVVGDGKHTIKELVAIKNQDPRRGLNYTKPLIKIKLDDHVKANLKSQKFDFGSIVAEGRKIYLRNNSNISTGGDSIDVTDDVHPDLKKIAVKVINAVPGLSYAGIDIMVKEDISQKPGKDGYVVLEINSSPGIFFHHFPYEGKSRNVATGIIDGLFPETIK
jgi:glutamate--cysteine ligase